MTDPSEKGPTDLTGLSNFGKAIDRGADLIKGLVERVCFPSAEELGLLFRDQVAHWRRNNAERLARKTRPLLDAREKLGQSVQIHPRVVAQILDKASWEGDDFLQDYWAGLLTSSCSADGQDQTNSLFVDLLGRLTSPQVRLLDHICVHCEKGLREDGRPFCHLVGMEYPEIQKIMGVQDIGLAECYLDALVSLQLVRGGGSIDQTVIIDYGKSTQRQIPQVTPEPLALQLYVRCHGSQLSVIEFFKIERDKRDPSRSPIYCNQPVTVERPY